jgi:dimethylglycine dehydrogenase
MDVARFGDWAGPAYTNAKVRENYSRRFRITFPNEELPAARPLRTTAIYDRLKARGAVFGASYGLEQALWFAPEGREAVETVTFRRSNAHDPVGAECRAVRGAVGIIETSGFAKYAVTGKAAEAWLARLLAGRLPAADGRITLAPMLSPAGGIIGDFTVARLGPEEFMVFGSGQAEDYHMRWFEAHLEDGVDVRPLRSALTGLSVAGPRSRELMARVASADVSREAFPFMAFCRMDVGRVPAMVGRITFTGELGYEIWVAPDWLLALHDTLLEAGADLGLKHFGGRALNSLRLEKSFGAFTREYTPDMSPFQAGLGRFIDLGREGFIGRDAALRAREATPDRRLVTLAVGAGDADAFTDEPVWHDGRVVGWTTSGGWGHVVGKSIALAYIPPAIAREDAPLEVEILGERRAARVAPRPLFDPDGARMRS